MNNTPSPNLSLFSDEFLGNWLVGFINAEGSFTGSGTFSLEHTDAFSLSLLIKILNLNLQVRPRQVRGTRLPTFTVAIASANDLRVLINHLDTHYPLQGHKMIQYQT